MWKRSSRSSALDRAQALLSAKRISRDAGSGQGSTDKTPSAASGSVKTRSAPSNVHTILSDLSDLSSVSSAPEHGAVAVGSASAGKTQGREGGSTKNLRPQSSLGGGGGGSRFLKKAPPPATSNSQSQSQGEQMPVPRNVPSSLRGSQTSALYRVAEIENRIRSRKQGRQRPKPAEDLTLDLGLSPTVQHSAESSNDQNRRGKLFLKNNTVVTLNNNSIAGAHAGVRSTSRAATSAGSETKSVRAVSTVSLESDEEDMRKLLGDLFDSVEKSSLIHKSPSSTRTADKMTSRSSQVHSTPLPAAAPQSSSTNTTPPYSPASSLRHSSPFRFTGQAQAHFSPSVISPSASPPCVSRPGRLNSFHRVVSPQHSPPSMSGHSEVLSLEELFPVGPGSEDPHSEMSSVSSEGVLVGEPDFRINVMTLDDLAPADLRFTEETPEKEREATLSAPVPAFPNRPQLLGLKDEDEEQDEALDYQSDFESESRTEPEASASLVSEHLQGPRDAEELLSEIREETSDMSCGKSEDDSLSTYSDTSCSYSSSVSQHSQTANSGWSSRSSRSHGSKSFYSHSRRRDSTQVSKEAAVQTQLDPLKHPWPAGAPAVGLTYMAPTPVLTHSLSAGTVEALSVFNPAAFALNELLKQQLATARRLIESSRRLHSSLLRSLEPPDYRYTTLEDTREYIRKHRPPKLTMEEALEEVLQDMRDS